MKKYVVYRCLACGTKHIETLENTVEALDKFAKKLDNLLVCLCTPCETRFQREGPFWEK